MVSERARCSARRFAKVGFARSTTRSDRGRADGERLHQKIGDIVLQTGDTLLLEARPSFVQQHRNSRDFFLVSPLEFGAAAHERAPVALVILVGMVVLATVFEQVPYFVDRGYSTLHAALLAGVMLLTGCCSADTCAAGRLARADRDRRHAWHWYRARRRACHRLLRAASLRWPGRSRCTSSP